MDAAEVITEQIQKPRSPEGRRRTLEALSLPERVAMLPRGMLVEEVRAALARKAVETAAAAEASKGTLHWPFATIADESPFQAIGRMRSPFDDIAQELAAERARVADLAGAPEPAAEEQVSEYLTSGAPLSAAMPERAHGVTCSRCRRAIGRTRRTPKRRPRWKN